MDLHHNVADGNCNEHHDPPSPDLNSCCGALIPTTSDLASFFALGGSLQNSLTRNRNSSFSSVDDTIHALRTFRRLLHTFETVRPVPRKATPSRHAANNPTASPTKTPSRRSSTRTLQRAVSSRVEGATETAMFQALIRIIHSRFRQCWKPGA
ncbi:hypothetical protein EDB19DRAFT_1005272 [Suillus lakei]|nr:hypothetical protein EDB19DRAFT_1005272 [Suillus lakei]